MPAKQQSTTYCICQYAPLIAAYKSISDSDNHQHHAFKMLWMNFTEYVQELLVMHTPQNISTKDNQFRNATGIKQRRRMGAGLKSLTGWGRVTHAENLDDLPVTTCLLWTIKRSHLSQTASAAYFKAAITRLAKPHFCYICLGFMSFSACPRMTTGITSPSCRTIQGTHEQCIVREAATGFKDKCKLVPMINDVLLINSLLERIY